MAIRNRSQIENLERLLISFISKYENDIDSLIKILLNKKNLKEAGLNDIISIAIKDLAAILIISKKKKINIDLLLGTLKNYMEYGTIETFSSIIRRLLEIDDIKQILLILTNNIEIPTKGNSCPFTGSKNKDKIIIQLLNFLQKVFNIIERDNIPREKLQSPFNLI